MIIKKLHWGEMHLTSVQTIGFDFGQIIKHAAIRTIATMAINPFKEFGNSRKMNEMLTGVMASFSISVAQNAVLTCAKIADRLRKNIGIDVFTLEGLERISTRPDRNYFKEMNKAQEAIIGDMSNPSIYMKVS